MLNEQEAKGISAILRRLQEKDLLSLAVTVTNYLIVPESTEDAINAICLYSPTAVSILKRKKIKRELIFKYLHSEGQIVSPVAEKDCMIKAALDYWNPEDKLKNITLVTACSEPEDREMFAINKAPDAKAPESWHPSVDVKNDKLCEKSKVIDELGQNFISWFFEVWKSEHPRLLKSQNPNLPKFGPEIFWADCKCFVELNKGNTINTAKYDTNVNTAICLRKLLTEDNIILNPNTLGGGIQTKMDRFGLVTVQVSGTAHNLETCMGLFEQVFGLVEVVGAEGPSRSWKVKFTQLKIQCNVSHAELPGKSNHDMTLA